MNKSDTLAMIDKEFPLANVHIMTVSPWKMGRWHMGRDYQDDPTDEEMLAVLRNHYGLANGIVDDHDVHHGVAFVQLNDTVWGDYVGSSVSRSNYRVLLDGLREDGIPFLDLPWSHGAWSIGVMPEVMQEHHEYFTDLFDRLADYPLIDDDDHSYLEAEMFDEDWENWIASDLAHELTKLDEDKWERIFDELTYSERNELLYELYRESNASDHYYPEAEGATSVHLDVEGVAVHIQESGLTVRTNENGWTIEGGN